MTYHKSKDGYSYSDSRSRYNYYSKRDSRVLETSPSHGHSNEDRDDKFLSRENNRRRDHEYKHSKYRNSRFYPTDKGYEQNRYHKRSKSRSLSPSKDNKNALENDKKDNSNSSNSKADHKEDSFEEDVEESNIFTKYQQKTWKSKAGESSENEKRATVLVRCLDPEITEEMVESVISDIAIRNGFSTPNSVIFKNFHTNTISGSIHSPEAAANLHQNPQEYSYPYSLEKVAIVKFPSISAAERFMSCNKSRLIKLSGKDYYIEYDTSNNDSAVRSNEDPVIPAVAEISTMLQKRKLNSDWNCLSCRFLNFAKRVVCLSCGLPKPTDAEMEIQNKAIEIAAMNQAKMLQSNLLDTSPWIIVKNIPGDADPAKLVLAICKTVPEGPAELQRCVYVIDTNSGTKNGFMFAQFSSPTTVEKYVTKRGENRSEVIQCGSTYHRIDVVKSREKHAADELFKKLKMATMKVTYEFDTVNFETNLTSEDNTMIQLNKEYRTLKIKTTNVQNLKQQLATNDPHSITQTYLSSWLSDSIPVPSGKPDSATFQYDPQTDYFFDHRLNLYFDAATGFYMSLTGNYYVWDEPSSSLKRVDPNVTRPNTHYISQNTKPTGSNETNRQGSSSISNILSSAMKVAKVSQQNVQKLSSVFTEKKEVAKPSLRTSINIGKTFDIANNSDDECDMEVDEGEKSGQNKISVNLNTTPTTKSFASHERRFDAINICFVCLRMFDSLDNLHIHEKESKYHKALLTHSQNQAH